MPWPYDSRIISAYLADNYFPKFSNSEDPETLCHHFRVESGDVSEPANLVSQNDSVAELRDSVGSKSW